jgi:hypothetical protein
MRRSTVLVSSTVGFAVLFVASGLAVGTTPDATDSGLQVVKWLAGHHDGVRRSLWCITIALMLFAVFAALVREQLPTPHRDVFFFGAITLAAETAVQGWVLAGLSWHASQLAPATARTVLDVASYWGPVLTSATVLMLAPVALLALRGQAGLPRWLGMVAAVAVVEQLVETITIFGKTGFIAPGGPMNLVLGGYLTTIAFVCTGIAVARATDDTTSTTAAGRGAS